jgi:ABC-2 type transport system ATP-binding protein
LSCYSTGFFEEALTITLPILPEEITSESRVLRKIIPREVTTMLEVQHLYRSYRTIPAVEDVSFRVGAGEVVGFLGPNGAGKSTTVKIITGMLRPNEGKVLFEGQDIEKDMVGYRAQLGYVPEEAHLYSYMSGLEYLQLVGRLRGLGEAVIETKATRLLKLLNLESWQYSPISTYSKGMRQRVLIAASLLHDPKLLIFDEPLSGLDVVSGRLFKDLLELLAAQGKAVLYISHVLEVVEQVCNRVIVIAKGRVLADAPPADLARLMSLPNLERVFAQLVEQQDTRRLAEQMVEVMQIGQV